MDVQSLGFISAVTPGGMVRLVQAIMRSFLVAFKVRACERVPVRFHAGRVSTARLDATQGKRADDLEELQQTFQAWYRNMTREGLEVRRRP